MPVTLHAQELAYIQSYSPCSDVVPQAYPNLLLTTSLDDPTVSYREAVKYVSLVRAAQHAHHKSHLANTSNKILSKSNVLLHISESGGHDGAATYDDMLQNQALQLAFLIDSIERQG